jgi:hypothetical protein
MGFGGGEMRRPQDVAALKNMSGPGEVRRPRDAYAPPQLVVQAQERLRVPLPNPSILTSAQKQELPTLIDRQQVKLRQDIETCRQWLGCAHKLLQAINQTPPSAMSDAERTALVAQLRKVANEANTLLTRILTRSPTVPTPSYGMARMTMQQQIISSTVPTSFHDKFRAAMQQQIVPSTVPTSAYDKTRAAIRQEIAPSSITPTSAYDRIPRNSDRIA